MAKSILDLYKEMSAKRKAEKAEQEIIIESIERESEQRRKEWRNYIKKNEVVGYNTLTQSAAASSSAAGGGSGNKIFVEAECVYVIDCYVLNYFCPKN